LARRPYWALRYTDGRVIDERELDWSLAPKRGRASVRLYCPDGRVAELGNTADATDRLFQFKCAELRAGVGRATLAHVIGLIHSTDGRCTLAAWECDVGRLVTLEDNAHMLRYRNVGPISADHVGVRPD
jgi:hypothetical protein